MENSRFNNEACYDRHITLQDEFIGLKSWWNHKYLPTQQKKNVGDVTNVKWEEKLALPYGMYNNMLLYLVSWNIAVNLILDRLVM